MNTEVVLFIIFFISFAIGVLIGGAIEYLNERIEAHRQYIKHLEKENQHLKRVVGFYSLVAETKEV